MNIINPKSLALNRTMQFLGNDLKYRIQKEISVAGYALDLTNSYGVSGVTSEVESILSEYLNDWQEIIINDKNFGSGYMSSLSFSSANDVRVKEYNATFTIYETGDLSSLGIAGLSAASFVNVNSISESFTKDQNQNQNTYTHDVKIQTVDSISGNGIPLAKEIANTLLGSEDFIALEWGTGRSPYNSFYSESYNKITNDCSFSKKYELNSGDFNFLTSKKISFDFGENGVITVTENAEFKSKWDKFTECLNSGRADLLSSFSRCSGSYNLYKTSDMSLSGLYPNPITKGFMQSEKDGSCSYNVVYSNDKFYTDNSCYWDYIGKIETSENGINLVSEDGNVIGPDVIDGLKKQTAANDFWTSTIKVGLKNRLSAFYNLYKLPTTCSPRSLFLNQRSVTKNNRSGRLNYSCSYTDDPARVGELDSSIKKVTKECSTQAEQEITLSSNTIVPKFQEIKQIAENNKNPNKTTSSVSINGGRKTLLLDYINYGKPLLCNKIDDHLNGASYSLDPINNSFKISTDTFSVINTG